MFLKKNDFILIPLGLVALFTMVFFVYVILGKAFDQIQKSQDRKEGISLISQMNPAKITFLPHKNNNELPYILAKAYYLEDYDSGFVLVEKNSAAKLPIASTTKIATALVVIQNHSNQLDDTVTITPKMININGAKIGLEAGEKITVRNLLYGMLINSGNDAAYSLAEFFGGKENFVAQMNKKVRDIGLKSTEYRDPAGLDDTGYSTAHDLAVLASYALKEPLFNQIVRIPSGSIFSTDGKIVHELKNSNQLLDREGPFYFEQAIGVKTGFTYEAGHVLVSAAQKDGHTLLSVVMCTDEDNTLASAKESRKLLEWGFGNWTWR